MTQAAAFCSRLRFCALGAGIQILHKCALRNADGFADPDTAKLTGFDKRIDGTAPNLKDFCNINDRIDEGDGIYVRRRSHNCCLISIADHNVASFLVGYGVGL